MRTFNALMTTIFDVVLTPLGYDVPWLDLVLWPVLGGIVALLVIKAVSNQDGINTAKNWIQVHLLEVVLFKDDLGVVLPATAKSLWYNARYLGYNIIPMLVMFIPMTVILTQLVANYAYAPLPAGSDALLVVKLEADGAVKPADVSIDLPPGISLDAPLVRTADGEVAARLRLDAEGDHVVTVHAGGTDEAMPIAVGGPPRKVSVMRTKSWEALLYPASPVPASDSPVYSITLDRKDRSLPFFPDGESGILGWFFGASLLAGFLLKDRFGVTL